MTDANGFEEHGHDKLVHSHRHNHVTHNLNERTGGFDHLSSEHEHDHDHAALRHAHWPHQDFDHEHRFEAHDHDHGEPVKGRAPAKKARVKSVAPKKASPKKS